MNFPNRKLYIELGEDLSSKLVTNEEQRTKYLQSFAKAKSPIPETPNPQNLHPNVTTETMLNLNPELSK
jgi:hypothetical protein